MKQNKIWLPIGSKVYKLVNVPAGCHAIGCPMQEESMKPFWGGILIGMLVGANLAIVLIGLLVFAKCGECGAWIQQKLDGSSVAPRPDRSHYRLGVLTPKAVKNLPTAMVSRIGMMSSD